MARWSGRHLCCGPCREEFWRQVTTIGNLPYRFADNKDMTMKSCLIPTSGPHCRNISARSAVGPCSRRGFRLKLGTLSGSRSSNKVRILTSRVSPGVILADVVGAIVSTARDGEPLARKTVGYFEALQYSHRNRAPGPVYSVANILVTGDLTLSSKRPPDPGS